MLAALSFLLVTGTASLDRDGRANHRRDADATSLIDGLRALIPKVDAAFTVPISDWRFSSTDLHGGEQADDSQWQKVAPGFSWHGENTRVWFRTRLVVPRQIGGQSIEGRPVRLDLGVDDDGELYLGGRLKEAFHWDDCEYTLEPKAHSGDSFDIAIHGINGPGDGQLRKANLVVDVLPELRQYVMEAGFVELLQGRVSGHAHDDLVKALKESEDEIEFSDIEPSQIEPARRQLKAALARLVSVSPITKAADVYYVGHAHIDMNWLWTWPETIDVCHRTWDSAMNLMEQFPGFAFVQSQPGAYLPIQQQFPGEFQRMQEMQKRGQWDLVGGLWNESDTNLPSGEALARSFFLGQRYFKSNFGAYATTGWLPDSFGHSWQLPQLMRLAGIDSFYHMRGGNGLPYSWWESPDGSRVLKANVEPYNADVNVGQLAEPWPENARDGLSQSLVVFGVGDHGGGPTREELLTLQRFESDPVLPRVHMTSADAYFKQLAAQPAAAALPVVDDDLQFLNEGCYTTRADLKKALRDSENGLYTSEALSALAAEAGAPYPAADFRSWWATTAFAQFHDIACGSAIHSTYDWMLDQMRPAIQASNRQADKAMAALAANVDTRMDRRIQTPGDTAKPGQAIVVWNPLSFPRDDVVRIKLVEPVKLIHSVEDAAGHAYPAQVDSDGNLVFVARQVPGFGHAVYYPSRATPKAEALSLLQNDAGIEIENAKLALRIDKSTGSISEFKYKPTNWSVFGNARDADTLKLLGDTGDAWTFHYTGEVHDLSGPDATVQILEQGPVFDRIRVSRAFGPSHYQQDITVYAALDRVDIPTDIAWHDHAKALKVMFPIAAGHPFVRCQIPYGTIDRPNDGRECPGQKWMDLSDETPQPVTNATTLDLTGPLNSVSTGNFDTVGYGYPPDELPAPGTMDYGSRHVPFETYFHGAGAADNVSAQGQTISIPHEAHGDTLYLLASSAPTGSAGAIRFVMADGSIQAKSVEVNDWCLTSFHDNEAVKVFTNRYSANPDRNGRPKLWIVSVKLPAGEIAQIRLPVEPRMHLFAATLADAVAPTPVQGLTILNDAKYGFDVDGSLFGLTLLRSSSSPDTNPDEGEQRFTYSLYPHAGDWRAAHSEEAGLALNVPLVASVTDEHPAAKPVPTISIANIGGKGDVLAGALKRCEDGPGYILRLYEVDGQDTRIKISFDRPVQVEETDILERPIHRHALAVFGDSVTLPVGHDQIVTLRIDFKPS
ncbi:MAG TPA: glycoside hydrolase family 38 C-terminal domain-containing protein [Fimbriimonadaceae bacterium]|nr:glycoside hydrolase family 38 C-terminal domain-containing protein [Fimbriimonadaceae bacterium]